MKFFLPSIEKKMLILSASLNCACCRFYPTVKHTKPLPIELTNDHILYFPGLMNVILHMYHEHWTPPTRLEHNVASYGHEGHNFGLVKKAFRIYKRVIIKYCMLTGCTVLLWILVFMATCLSAVIYGTKLAIFCTMRKLVMPPVLPIMYPYCIGSVFCYTTTRCWKTRAQIHRAVMEQNSEKKVSTFRKTILL